MESISIIGGGSWATALVKITSNSAKKVIWWVRTPEAEEHIKKYHHNPNYLTSVEIDTDIVEVTTDLHRAMHGSNVIIIAHPSAFIHGIFEHFNPEGLEHKFIFSAIKGIIPEFDSIPLHYFHKQFSIPYSNLGVICGPCHAEEVAMERLSYLTICAQEVSIANKLAETLNCRYIKTTTSDDIFGAELSAILKNVYAIAGGICHGLGYGDNFQAVLMSNALQEIKRFIGAVDPMKRKVTASAYLGDLLVTGYSQFSRNRTFGNMIGKGYSVRSAQLEMNMIAEGYYASKSIHAINEKFKVDIPIADAVYRIIYERMSPSIEMRILADKLS
ncbi:MAG: NAD(P)H-dependent glycerol-3-phosphate dehydrogenase [Luteibaculaceae bacterium]